MRVGIFGGFIGLLLFVLGGCSVGPVVSVAADAIDHNEPAGVRLMHCDHQTGSMVGSLKDFLHLDFVWQTDSRKDQDKVCRIKYHNQYYKNRYIVVEGRIGLRGKRYPVVLDTGASQPMFLNITHVLENKLPVYLMADIKFDLNGYKLGLCELPLLQIGDISIINRPCLYLEAPATMNVFGLYIAGKNTTSKTVIIGLPLLKQFKYVMFDNVRNEVELSYTQSFQADNTGTREKYPLSIEEDFDGNAFLFVRMPIAGQQMELQFDTGSSRGLTIGEGLWEQIGSRIRDMTVSRGRDFYPYIGSLECDKGVVAKLQVGDRMIRNAEVSIFPDDSPLLSDSEGLLGMQYFQNTVVVLDFERSLMWICNSRI